LRKFAIIVCFTTLSLFGAETEVDEDLIAANPTPVRPARTCKGIVLVGKDCLLSEKELSSFDTVEFCKLIVPGSSSNLKEELSEYISQPITKETLAAVRQTVREYYENNYHPLVEIVIPKQDITSGVMQVQVVESKFANLEIVGNKHTSAKRLTTYLGVNENDPIDVRQLKNDLSFMNRNPFRRVNLVYSPGLEPNTTDIELLVDDRRPFRVYAGVDDTGVETTERGRIFAGFNCANWFSLDHFLTFQYTTSYNLHSFQASTAQYVAYLPWKHILSMYGGYSSVHSSDPFLTSNHGKSSQASARYEAPLNSMSNYTHSIGFGFDFKQTNNTILFSELAAVVGQTVNLSQFVATYAGSYELDPFRLDVQGELFFSPGAMLPDESNSAYASLRPGAKNQWVYGYLSLSYSQTLAYSFHLLLTARGQLSSQNLLPSEQIGLGGFDSVRGYDERQLNYDNGVILNGEIRTPGIAIFRRKKAKFKDALQLLGFVDYGYGNNRTLLPGEPKNDHLIGIGPGLRYTLDPWVTARFDLGVKLYEQSIFTGGSSMWYFSVVANI